MTDAAEFLRALEGKPIRTISGRENRVLLVSDGEVVVTVHEVARWPTSADQVGVQDAIDRLERDREIEISVESVRYRSAFIGVGTSAASEGVSGANKPATHSSRLSPVRGRGAG